MAEPRRCEFNICHSTFNISQFSGSRQTCDVRLGSALLPLPSPLPRRMHTASATPKIMRPVGLALWLGTGALAFLLARLVPFGRGRRWLGELAAVLLTAFVLGVVATGLDFGGWSEPDPRAGLFTFLGSGAILGILRVATHNLRSEDSR